MQKIYYGESGELWLEKQKTEGGRKYRCTIPKSEETEKNQGHGENQDGIKTHGVAV